MSRGRGNILGKKEVRVWSGILLVVTCLFFKKIEKEGIKKEGNQKGKDDRASQDLL